MERPLAYATKYVKREPAGGPGVTAACPTTARAAWRVTNPPNLQWTADVNEKSAKSTGPPLGGSVQAFALHTARKKRCDAQAERTGANVGSSLESPDRATAQEPASKDAEQALSEADLPSSLADAALKAWAESTEDIPNKHAHFNPSLLSYPFWKAEKDLAALYGNVAGRASLKNSPFLNFVELCTKGQDSASMQPTLDTIHALFVQAAEYVPQMASAYAFAPERCLTLLVTLLMGVYSREARRSAFVTHKDKLTVFLYLLRLLNYFDQPRAFQVRELLSIQRLLDHGIKYAPSDVSASARGAEQRSGDWISTAFPLARTLPTEKPLRSWTIVPPQRVHRHVIATALHVGAMGYALSYWAHFCVPERSLASEPSIVALLLRPFGTRSGKALDVAPAHAIFDTFRKSGEQLHGATVLLAMKAYALHRKLDLAENLFHMHVKTRILESAHASYMADDKESPADPWAAPQMLVKEFYTEMILRLFSMYASLLIGVHWQSAPADPGYILQQSCQTLKWLAHFYPAGMESCRLKYRLQQIVQHLGRIKADPNSGHALGHLAYVEKWAT